MENEKKAIYDIALSYHINISSNEIIKLFEKYKSSEEIFQNSEDIKFLSGGKINIKKEYIEKAKQILDFMKKSQIEYIKIDDEFYPDLLKEIPDKPFILFLKGNKNLLKSNKMISIVGTRNPINISIDMTRKVCSLFCEYDYVTISGLAKGIDYEVHYSTIKMHENKNAQQNSSNLKNSISKGKTIAVFGSGIDIIYPAEHKELVREILDNDSLIISEYPPGIKPYKKNFPMRNRIIAGLSKDLVLIQAPKKSGSSITAYLAFQYNRNLHIFNPDIPVEILKDFFYDNIMFIEKTIGESFKTQIELFNKINS